MTVDRFRPLVCALLMAGAACDSDKSKDAGGDAKDAKAKADDPAKKTDGAKADDAKADAMPWDAVYMATPTDKFYMVDIIDAESPKGEEALAELSQDDTDGIERQVDPKDPRFPKGHEVGAPWIVVGDATQTAKAASFGVNGGASEIHFTVVLEGAKNDANPVLAYQGAKPVAEGAKLVEAKHAKADKSTYTRIKAHFDKAKFEEEGDKLYKSAKLGPEHLKVYTPKMGGDAEQLVVVHIEIPDPDEPDDGLPYYIAGLHVLHKDGKITDLHAPSAGIDMVEVSHFVDLNGDGVDEIVWTSSYYEGSYNYLTRWDGPKPETRTLTGDGA